MKNRPMLGSFELQGIEYIESLESRALAEHRVPGLAGNYLQDMGSEANAIVISGTRYGDDQRDDFLNGIREIFNKGEPTTFVADINTATDITQVVIEDLRVAEVAGSPDTFHYVLQIRKYTKPPEPPAAPGLDSSVLDDAMGALGAMDVLDNLVNIPSLADPSVPLKGAMSGVQSSTAVLGQVASPLKKLLGTG
jgi:hypothetical protein